MIEADAAVLAESIRRDFPVARTPRAPARPLTTAAKIIDCVLSLRKPYTTVVVPRVSRFMDAHPHVRACADLRALVGAYATPAAFVAAELQMNSARKAAMVLGVVEYLLDAQRQFNAPTEEERLTMWARWARPTDYLLLDVPNFKLAGFQYLRMHFGADTVKPDVYILRYVQNALGRMIAGRPEREVQAVYAMERASVLLGRAARSVDANIWEKATDQALPS
ncbi:MAG: hypothetical protein DYG92_10965 [Leptolyngbya sp. PLA1]|nr:hypothetical protein [Leptolyngbya sp. PLA1]